MRTQMRILSTLSASLEATVKANPSFSKGEILLIISSQLSKEVEDKQWFFAKKESLAQAIKAGIDPRAWLAQQLAALGVYQASSPFQNNRDQFSCMSFVCDFLQESNDPFFYDFDQTLEARVKGYFPTLNPISRAKLKHGDIILYYQNGEPKLGHIALYLTTINNTIYAISKLGSGQNTFIHPIEGMSDKYVRIKAYATGLAIKPKIQAKFELAKQELKSHLPKPILFFLPDRVSENKQEEVPAHSTILAENYAEQPAESWDQAMAKMPAGPQADLSAGPQGKKMCLFSVANSTKQPASVELQFEPAQHKLR